MSMVSQNVVNSEKKGKIEGNTFHLFYMDLNTSILFDKDLTTPIIHGSKSVVLTHLKKIDQIIGGVAKPSTKVRIYSYIITQDGYRRIDTYNGPIETIGKYIRRY
jgi:hypothetical protein